MQLAEHAPIPHIVDNVLPRLRDEEGIELLTCPCPLIFLILLYSELSRLWDKIYFSKYFLHGPPNTDNVVHVVRWSVYQFALKHTKHRWTTSWCAVPSCPLKTRLVSLSVHFHPPKVLPSTLDFGGKPLANICQNYRVFPKVLTHLESSEISITKVLL